MIISSPLPYDDDDDATMASMGNYRMAAQVAVQTVHDVMVQIGIDDATLFNGATAAVRFATELFDDDFNSCMDKTFTELDDDLKLYSTLTVVQGQIRVTPGQKRALKALIQWSKDKIRMNQDPAGELFPLNRVSDLILRAKSHIAYVNKSKTLIENAKPKDFDEKMKWDEWKPTFINFLRAIPGRNGVPLKYVVRDDIAPLAGVAYTDFIDEYVDNAPLTGPAFTIDAADVHTYIVKFMSGNATAESKLLPIADEQDGRKDFMTLKAHYEGVGVNARDTLKADKIIENLFYAGEKKPHMWWDEFEKQLNLAFTIYDQREKREVYSDHMKLRILHRKISADFLQHVKASINVELNRDPVTITYAQALSVFRDEVNRKFPPEVSNNNSRARRVNEANTGGRGGRGRGRGGRGRGGRGGRGRGGRHGDGRSRSRGHPDARNITGNDGNQIEVHASYNFPSPVWNNIPSAEKERLKQERINYKRQRTISALSSDDIASIVSGLTNATGISIAATSTGASQNNGAPSSIMGGRNEQAALRSRNTNNTNN